MKLTTHELEFLAAWAREEWEPACYQLPAHKLQLEHGISGASLTALIKAWTIAEGKKDYEITEVPSGPTVRWPWNAPNQLQDRLAAARPK